MAIEEQILSQLKTYNGGLSNICLQYRPATADEIRLPFLYDPLNGQLEAIFPTAEKKALVEYQRKKSYWFEQGELEVMLHEGKPMITKVTFEERTGELIPAVREAWRSAVEKYNLQQRGHLQKISPKAF